MGVDTVRWLAEAAHLADRREILSDEDIEAFAGMKVALEAGFPEEALAQLSRVYVDALGRIAEAETRLFHFYVHERLKAEGVSERDLWKVSDTARQRTVPLTEPLILYFHRKAAQAAICEDAVMHLQAVAPAERA